MRNHSQRIKQKTVKQKQILNGLWKYRKEYELTQKDVAYILGIKNASQISHWDRGEKIPGTRNILKLFALYQGLPNDLLWGLRPPPFLLTPTQMERPRRLYCIKSPRPIQSGVQIVSIEDRNPYKNIEENVRKLTLRIRVKWRQVKGLF